MAYEKQIWNNGDIITANKMNHIEDGIAESGGSSDTMILTTTVRQATVEECPNGGSVIEYSHSWQEIHDALLAGKRVVATRADGDSAMALLVLTAENISPNGHTVTGIMISSTSPSAIVESLPFENASDKTVIHCEYH